MLSLDASIALGGGKQPLIERRPSLAKLIKFENRYGSIPRWRRGGGGRLCEILAKWGWAFTQTGALTRVDTVHPELATYLSSSNYT